MLSFSRSYAEGKRSTPSAAQRGDQLLPNAPSGTATTPYGFTGEYTDPYIKLVYLRSRWYSPGFGRFTSKDTYRGDYKRPITLNHWNYAYSNPVRYADPTGNDPIKYCVALLAGLVVADGPLPIGDIAGIAACTALLASSGASAIAAAEHGEDFGEAADTLVGGVCWTWEMILSLPESSPDQNQRPKVQPAPDPLVPPITETPQPRRCKPSAFTKWWFSLNAVPGGVRPKEDWYVYEQRVARADGVLGNSPRCVPTGKVDADGIEPETCQFIDAKYSSSKKSQFREGGPPWIEGDLVDEFQRYRNAINTSNGIPDAQPTGLIVRTNDAKQVPFFESLLQKSGFKIGYNGTVQVIQ